MEQQKPFQIQYRMTKMDTVRFDAHAEKLKDGDVEFQSSVQFSYNTNIHCVRCRMQVNMVQNASQLMESELDCYFELNPESVNSIRQDGNIVIPSSILIQFASLCYGSMRGVIHTKTTGTPLNRFILPPYYFQNSINQDYIVKE